MSFDIGNSNIFIGLHEDGLSEHLNAKGKTNQASKKINSQGKLVHTWRVTTKISRTADEYRILIKNLLSTLAKDSQWSAQDLNFSLLNNAVISSVVPDTGKRLNEVMEKMISGNSLVVRPGVKTGMNIKLENPREAGSDRIINAVGAYQKYNTSLIIADFGTATTYSAISSRGEYLGGAIAPGLSVAIEALFDRAAKLPQVEIDSPENIIGKNTTEALKSGLITGQVAQAEGMIARFKEKLSLLEKEKYKTLSEITVLATGGLAHHITPETDSFDYVEPNLSLLGLYHIAKLNGLAE